MAEMKVVIPPELKRRFKLACVNQEKTMSDVVCVLIEQWLKQQSEVGGDEEKAP
jgi:hypothetical protein